MACALMPQKAGDDCADKTKAHFKLGATIQRPQIDAIIRQFFLSTAHF